MCPAVWDISDLGIFVMLSFRLDIGILVGAWFCFGAQAAWEEVPLF